jgi:hypothetical protein
MAAAKMDGMISELRKMGGKSTEIASKIEQGLPVTPSELINANKSLPENSAFRFNDSTIRALGENPTLFVADVPSLVTPERQEAYNEALDAGELSALVTLVGGPESGEDEGRLKTVPMASAESRRLRERGWIESSELEGLGGDGRPSDTITAGFLKEFNDQSNRFIGINNSFNTILASSRENNAPGHVAMIFAFMKMLDPTSVVREGEQLTAQQARAMGDTITSYWNRLLTGKKLTDTQVENFLNVAEGVWTESAHGQANRESQ